MKPSPYVIEIVGPAGAGKTTLLNAMRQCRNTIHTSIPPDLHKSTCYPFYARNIPPLLPNLLYMSIAKNSRKPMLREIAWMAVLNGWHRILREQASDSSTIIILDQGPVYLLAGLYGFGPESFNRQGMEKWRKRICQQWANTLDMVICVDAPDATLVDRIHGRRKWHTIKDLSASDGLEFLLHSRLAFEKVLSIFKAEAKDLEVLRFNTAQESLDAMVNQVMIRFTLPAPVLEAAG